MREIKFRGKRIDNGEWVCGCYVKRDNGDSLIFQPISGAWLEYEVDPATVGQFSNMRDKDGQEIYEGDIVKYTYLPGKTFWNFNGLGIISWKSTGFHLGPLPGKGGVSSWLVGLPGLGASEKPNELLEVIGNIHDNPELLK